MFFRNPFPEEVADIRRRAHHNAQNGMAFLDAHHPGWEKKVPDSVNIRFGDCCIVPHLTGYLYGKTGLEILGVKNPVTAGLFVEGDKESPRVIEEYAFLTMEFKTGVANRLEEKRRRLEIAGATTGVNNEVERELVAV